MTPAQAMQVFKESLSALVLKNMKTLERREIRSTPNQLLPLNHNELTSPEHRIKDTHVNY